MQIATMQAANSGSIGGDTNTPPSNSSAGLPNTNSGQS